MAEKKKYIYNTNLAKGTGFVNETLTLLEFYEQGDSKESFLKRCLQFNPLNKSTEKRTKDLITLVFFNRFWKTENVISQLKILRENGASLSVMSKIILVYTADANRILSDFIIEIISSNKTGSIKNQDALHFIDEAITIGNAPVWSDIMKKRVASYLITCLVDFEMIDRSGSAKYFYPESFVVNYFLHELHFNGLSDSSIIKDKTWKILQLTEHETIKEIEKISFTGAFIYQFSGEIITISWKYKNMIEFIENEYRQKI